MCEQKDYIHCFNNEFVFSLKDYRTVRVASIGATTGALGSQGLKSVKMFNSSFCCNFSAYFGSVLFTADIPKHVANSGIR